MTADNYIHVPIYAPLNLYSMTADNYIPVPI